MKGMCLLCTSRGVATGHGSLFRARGVYGGYGQGRLEKIAVLQRCFLPRHLGVEDSRNAPGVGVYLALLLEEVVGWFMPPLDGVPVVISRVQGEVPCGISQALCCRSGL